MQRKQTFKLRSYWCRYISTNAISFTLRLNLAAHHNLEFTYLLYVPIQNIGCHVKGFVHILCHKGKMNGSLCKWSCLIREVNSTIKLVNYMHFSSFIHNFTSPSTLSISLITVNEL